MASSGTSVTRTRLHIGAKALKSTLQAYAKRFDLLEVLARPAESGGAAQIEPNVATLKRWRKQVPVHFTFSVVAGQHLSLLKPSTEMSRDLEIAKTAIDLLQARCFLLRTPPEVTPSKVWRDRLAKVADKFPKDATHFVWEPSGLWEVEDAARFAKQLGVVVAVDAARDPVPSGAVAYVRLRTLGETRSFGPAALERVVASIGSRRDAFVILESPTALQECKRLRQIAQKPASAGQGGMGRVIRPRGALIVGDDEQE